MLEIGTLLEHMSDAVVELDSELVVMQANERAALLYRRPINALVGKKLTDLFPDLLTTGAIDQLRAARDGRVPVRLEIFLPSLFAWHAVLAVPQASGVVLLVRDVSDRVRRESSEAARAAVQKIIENMPLCVTITRGAQHRIDLVNRLARALVGDRPVEGELLERVLPEAREQGFIDLLDKVYSSGESYRGEEVELTWKPNGESESRLAVFDLTYQPMFGSSGSVEGILHLGTDVTEKVHRRLQVEQYASERQAVLEQLEEGVILTDEEGRITFVNQAAERMHGVKLLGVGPSDSTAAYSLLTDSGEPHPPEQLPLARAVAKQESVTGAVWKIRRSDSTILRVRGNAKPVFREGRLVACVLTIAPYN